MTTPLTSKSTRIGAGTVIGALCASILVAASPATAAADDLFISEYVEGSGFNKAVEIYNGTGAAVDLSNYAIEPYQNGSPTATSSIELQGTLEPGDVYVLASSNTSSTNDVAALADQTSGSVGWNGDDAVVLAKGDTVLDVLGVIGERPDWGSDVTLRRAAAVCEGATTYVASQWSDAGANVVDGLGSHTATCGPVEDVPPTVDGVSPADGAMGVATAVAPVVTFSEPVTAADGTFSLECDDAAVTIEVTGEGDEYTLTPDAALAEAAECEITVDASGVTDLDGETQDAMEATFTSTFTVSEGVVGIGAVQGSTDVSPYDGQVVTVEGVVVGDYEGTGAILGGFYVQSRDEDADGDPATSEGIYVYHEDTEDLVSLGDVVSVTGEVVEYQGQTQIGFPETVEVLDGETATATPASVTLPFADANEAERYEGMSVEFGQELFVTEFYLLGRFGEITVSSGGRQDQPTAVVEPGAEANALQAANDLNRIKLDDAFNNQNPETIIYGGGGEPLSADNPLRGGDSVTGLTGVMTYSWAGNSASGNAWRVRPPSAESDAPVFESNNPRPTAAPEVGGSLKVASFNVLNYFTTIDGNGPICGPVGEEQFCRGADSQLELDRQTEKLVDAMITLDADVIGIMEMENTPGAEPLDYLAEQINAVVGDGTYSYVDSGTVGTDVIRVGFLYNTTTVTEAGDFAVLDSSVDPQFDDSNNRPALAQTFEEIATGETFTAVANHWKSKGSCASSGPNSDQGDGASCWNETRTLAAEAMVDWLETSPTGVEDTDVFILGDLNSYAQEDPIDVLRDAGYVEQGADGYGYVFDGQWGALDYVFASESLAEQVTGAAHVNINADEPSALDYNTDFKSEAQIQDFYSPDWYRTSDHDPLLVGLSLGGGAAETTTVQLLATNDFHGRILPNFGSGEAGAAVMAGAVEQLQGPYANSVFAAAGDLIGASSFESSVAGDKPTIDALNAMGLDVSAVGNHEFDQGYDDLIGRVMDEGNDAGGATWEYLGANVRFEDGGTAALPETWLATFDNATDDTADDVSIGFVGVVTDETPALVSPGGIEGLEFEQEAVAANRSAAMLEDEGADAIVLLVHEGAPTPAYEDAVDTENDFGEMLSLLDDSIDAVVSGHTHQLYNHEVPVAGWDGRDFGRPVVSAGQYGMNLNELLFEFDNAGGGLVGIGSDVIDIGATEQVDPQCVGTPEAPCATAPVFPADPEVQEIVEAAVEASEELGARTIGEVSSPLYRAMLEGSGPGSTRGAESTLGNAIADVHLWATEPNGAQIAFMNPGGLRADLLGTAGGTGSYPSDVSFRQAYDVQPFGNTLWTMDLTGAQIAELLEEQWQPEGSSRPFLRLGVSEGFVYTFDASAEPGERIVQMWLNDEPIAMDEVYTVGTNSFLAAGGDNFSTFTEGANAMDSARTDSDVMVSYMEANDSLGTEYSQRAVGLQADALEVEAGDDLSFDLSSLMFTGPGDLLDDTVTVSLARGELGSFPVTNELPTNLLDEHGTASVTVTIPAGVSGDVMLWVEGDTTGTRVPIALTVNGSGFGDVDGNEHAAAIQWLANQGITQGWSDGTFRPFQPAKRDAVATFLYRLAGSPEITEEVPEFSDIDDSMEHSEPIRWLVSEGISQGWSDGTFRPYQDVTRDAFATFLYRTAGEPTFVLPDEPTFPDIDPSMEHYAAIEWAASVGITDGFSDGTYRPYDIITRDAIAAFLFRYDEQF